MVAKNSGKNKVRINRKALRPCLVCTVMITLVLSRNTMEQKRCFIDISVVHVLHRRTRSVLIVPVIVRNV